MLQGNDNDVAPLPSQHHSITPSFRVVAFSPDDETIAGGSSDGIIRFWSALDGQMKRTIEGHEDAIQAIRFSADGKTVQTAGQSVKKWNISTGELVETIKLDLQDVKRMSRLFTFSPDGRMLAGQLRGSTSSRLTIWNVESGEIFANLELIGHPLDAAFSPDGRLLAIGTIALNDKQSTGAVQIFDAKTGAKKRTIETHPFSMSSVAFSPKGDLVAGGDHRKVRLWNASTGELKQTFEGHSGVIESIAFSPDGKKLASGAQGPPFRYPGGRKLLSEAKVWDLENGRLILSIAGESGRTESIAFSPDGSLLARCDHVSLVWQELEGGGRGWTKYPDWASPAIGQRIHIK